RKRPHPTVRLGGGVACVGHLKGDSKAGLVAVGVVSLLAAGGGELGVGAVELGPARLTEPRLDPGGQILSHVRRRGRRHWSAPAPSRRPVRAWRPPWTVRRTRTRRRRRRIRRGRR